VRTWSLYTPTSQLPMHSLLRNSSVLHDSCWCVFRFPSCNEHTCWIEGPFSAADVFGEVWEETWPGRIVFLKGSGRHHGLLVRFGERGG
jgi:hypothetical protein